MTSLIIKFLAVLSFKFVKHCRFVCLYSENATKLDVTVGGGKHFFSDIKPNVHLVRLYFKRDYVNINVSRQNVNVTGLYFSTHDNDSVSAGYRCLQPSRA